MARRKASQASRDRAASPAPPPQLRIVGGTFRGRSLAYSGDPRTRPMKDRVREAAFNLLAGRGKGRLVLDLFAGTGALGLEALSRGAERAIFLERHFPTTRLIQQNLSTLGAADRGTVVFTDTFFWVRHDWQPGTQPLLIFCSPPYDLYVSRHDEMLAMLARLIQLAPAGSTLVVESDERFEATQLGDADHWFVRAYPPAVLSLTDIPWTIQDGQPPASSAGDAPQLSTP